MSVLNYYNKSLQQALLHLFPDIGLEPSKIPRKIYKWSVDSFHEG